MAGIRNPIRFLRSLCEEAAQIMEKYPNEPSAKAARVALNSRLLDAEDDLHIDWTSVMLGIGRLRRLGQTGSFPPSDWWPPAGLTEGGYYAVKDDPRMVIRIAEMGSTRLRYDLIRAANGDKSDDEGVCSLSSAKDRFVRIPY